MKFCPSCGKPIIRETVIENPVCPKCGKKFQTGAKFCDEDGTKLVAQESIKYKCEKCGKEYSQEVKFCCDDGGRILPAFETEDDQVIPQSGNTMIDTIDKGVSSVVNSILRKIKEISVQNNWSGWVTSLLVVSFGL